ncbi:hypothetical protein C8D88_109400 [Lentzea atacamensis]|uniref:Ig-like domain-containing protein n=1 Tax=Lentzea atacamensis TaxID=531938 RepID=A0A316IAJ0_9PSEU|nr:hypothetical protein [Lentzea atacamensis]PWK84314.1 hypothetical protein C8D88_109400 [Lentzea atacamensis]RAS66672.1 hypothetical protein C8D87_10311 [Lentzea atacamensis]
MRKILAVLAAAALAFVSATPASAAVVLTATASAPSDAGALTVSFRIGGFPNVGASVTVQTAAKMTAVYACQNHGGNFPSDPKKTQVVSALSATGKFKVSLLGEVSGQLTITPPAPTLTCPKGQHVVLVSMSYDEVTVVSGSTTHNVAGTFSRVYLNI